VPAVKLLYDDEHKHRNNVSWFIAKRRGTRIKLDADKLKAETIKASVRAKMEHPFRYIKQVLGYGRFAIGALPRTPIDCTCWQHSATC
jgi:hypothetical protein